MGWGAAQVKWAWSTFWLGVYQPLAWLLFEVQYVFWKLDPHGYHLTSLILHAANAVVLYVLTVTLLVRCQTDLWLKSPWTCSLGAGLATALFAVHPLRVEAVAWASCQPYLPCALFSMLAVLAYLRAFEMGSSPRWGWLVASFVLFVAALLSHAVAVSLPVVLLILDVYPLRRFGDGPGRWFGTAARRVWWEKVPFIMVSLVFMGLAIAARSRNHWLSTEQNDASASIAQACYGIWFYIIKTVLPLDLVAVYPLPQRDRLARAAVHAEHPRDAGDERRLVSPAPALAGTAGGLAELPGDPGAQLGHHPDQRPDRRGSVQLHGDAGLGDRGGRLFLPARADAHRGCVLVPWGSIALGLAVARWV